MSQRIASIWHPTDIAILILYFAAMIGIGVAVMKKASKGLESYFLAGNRLPWYVLSISNASAMFDITGTMWLVYNIFVYGMKGIWLPWLWPTFNQVFLMAYLSVWIRRANVLTGAEWITSRFGEGRGAELSRMIVVVFALVSVIGFIAYAFQGMGRFSAPFLPWDLSANACGVIIMAAGGVSVLMGGMIGVVVTDVVQFVILAVCSLIIAIIAMDQVSPEQLAAVVPAGWSSPFFGWHLDLAWRAPLEVLKDNVAADGYSIFGLFFIAMLFKGILVSIAGPAPNYDMQRILAARTPRESALMSGVVSAALLPRWWMIGGITLLALHYRDEVFPSLGQPGFKPDFEMILPWVIRDRIPAGLLGVLVAGLLGAFMSSYSATVNAGGAYLVNDLYKRYLKTDGTARHYVAASWGAQVVIVSVGILFGYQAASINQVTQWIVNGLWGGYTAPNILKWHWHRFNGFGYFWGMLSGIAAALALPKFLRDLHPLWGFIPIFLISLAASILGSLLSHPEPDAVLVRFYKQVRPWGFWGPVLAKVRAADPSFHENRNAARDALNVALAIVAQMTLVTIPLYMVLRDTAGLWLSVLILLLTGWTLKKTWYERLDPD
jgi:Na+/proline symporter